MCTSCYRLGAELVAELGRLSPAHAQGRPRSSARPKQLSVQRTKDSLEAWCCVAHGAHVGANWVLHRQQDSSLPHREIGSLLSLSSGGMEHIPPHAQVCP